MHKYLTLTRVLVKNTMGMLADGKSKKALRIALYVLLLICCLPTVGLLYMMFDSVMEPLIMIHQEGALLGAGFHVANFITFFFSLFMIPSVFYFSKDSDTLLSLPLKPQTILASKFTVCLLYEYVFSFAITIPLMIAYTQHAQLSFIMLFAFLIILLTMPIFPLILSSIITMLIMRFVPFFKNRDRFNLIASILGIGVAVAFSTFMNSTSMDNMTASTVVTMLTENNGLLQLFGYLFPTVPFSANAIVNADLLQLGIYLVIILLSIFVFLAIGKYFYFKGAIGFNETGSSRKSISEKQMQKTAQQHNKIRTYMLKEVKLLVRTPIYFMNCIATAFLMPIILMITFYTTGSQLNLAMLKEFSFDGFLPYAIMVGLAIGLFFANLNLISATSISREGSNYVFMKYIPMDIKQQIEAKTYTGILVSILGQFVMIIVVYIVVPFFPITYYIVAFLASVITAILGNYIGILIDMIHPKLVWEQEAAAVKQNMSGVISMMGGMALCALLGFIIYKLPFVNVNITCGILVALCVLLTVTFRFIVLKKANYFFERM